MYKIINYGERLKDFFDAQLVNGYDENEVAFISGFSEKTIKRYINESEPISLKAIVVFIVTFKLSKSEAISFLSEMGFSTFFLRSKFNYKYIRIIINKEQRDKIADDYQNQKTNFSPRDFVYSLNKKK